MSATQRLPTEFAVNGQQIPSIGIGTFQGSNDNSRVKGAVIKALQRGYRHIDTAAAYGNEKEVGEGIKESGVSRNEIFVTTKLAQTWHAPEDVEEAIDQSLNALQLAYVPHAYAAGPNHSTLRYPDGKPIIDRNLSRAYSETWAAMEKLVDKGKTRLIGLSNFNILKTARILEVARIRPAVLQVELHPYLPQPELLAFCAREDIHLTAHQPLGGKPVAVVNPNVNHSGPLKDPDKNHPDHLGNHQILSIASALNKSSAQVLLSWAVQRGTSAVPKTVQEARMVDNREVFWLSNDDMQRINRIAEEKGAVRFLDPKEYIGFDIFDNVNDEPVIEGD